MQIRLEIHAVTQGNRRMVAAAAAIRLKWQQEHETSRRRNKRRDAAAATKVLVKVVPRKNALSSTGKSGQTIQQGV